MKKLFVLYDASCRLCIRCARWLAREPAYLPIEVLPSGSHKAATLFPALRSSPTPEDLVVVADSGEVYRGYSAWLMCLYALRRYRTWSFRLARPGWSFIARRAVEFLSVNRDTLGGYSGIPVTLDTMLTETGIAPCTDSACIPAPPPRPPRSPR